MIFATVGTQLPFDRLLGGLDTWARNNPGVPILAQCGDNAGHFPHIRTVSQLRQTSFRERFAAAKLIVAHAGMGTILSAAEMGKPIILMPRRAEFFEHRNDHQLDTAAEMSKLSNVTVVQNAGELHSALDLAVLQNFENPKSSTQTSADTLEPLISAVRDFVWTDDTDTARQGVKFGRYPA